MIRRILVGAAIAAAALGFSATGASADVGPSSNNSGQSILSQFSVLDDLTPLNGVHAHVLNNIDPDILNNGYGRGSGI
ncbi:hypothetical protein ABGB18_36340 [Nonomuraea sp. B12E4]|uniref:hypothetical protein n=1 Tax=Nonomuraea sp. B12E4 TaxID=3153564 RepID=UPI00325D9E18